MKKRIKPVSDDDTGSQLDRLQASEIIEAIAASRNDPRPDIAAVTVFAEIDALIDDIDAEQSGS
jgi:antitoxin StbD